MKHRFYHPHVDFSTPTINILCKDEIHHIKNVLRLKCGAHVCVFNGKGEEVVGIIKLINSQNIEIEIESHQKFLSNEPKIILACALPKKSKFETIIEKATELGADIIIPVKTKRTEIKLSDDFIQKKSKRFQTIAINAAKQSWRKTIPIIHNITPFTKTLKFLNKESQILIPSLCASRINLINAFSQLDKCKPISFLIGPEGDFTQEEYQAVQKLHGTAVTLGETILKVETAALYALSCANSYFHSPEI